MARMYPKWSLGWSDEATAKEEVMVRKAWRESLMCPVFQKPCSPRCASYSEPCAQHRSKDNPNSWQVFGGTCTCALVTGSIEHDGLTE